MLVSIGILNSGYRRICNRRCVIIRPNELHMHKKTARIPLKATDVLTRQ